MIWKTVFENAEHYPKKGERGFKKKTSEEKASKVMTVRLSEEQIDLMKRTMKNTPYNSLSDFTRAAIGHYMTEIYSGIFKSTEK